MKATPTLRQMRHFLALAEHAHFGHAAEACYVTQSTLSASLKEMETILGVELVERTKRRVMITPLGAEVVQRVRQILLDVDDLCEFIQSREQPLTGPLRLGSIPTIGPYLLPRVLPHLRTAYPDLQLYLREETSADLIQSLDKGQIDLALLAFPYDYATESRFDVGSDSFWIALPARHPLRHKERIHVNDLAGETILRLEDGHCLRDQTESFCALTANPATQIEASSLFTLVQMTANGLGLAIVPKMAVDAGLLKGTRLQTRPLEGKNTTRQIALIWRRSSPREEEYRMLGLEFRHELGTAKPADLKRRKRG